LPRGFVWRRYTTDDGVQYATRVDADYAAETARGWPAASAAGLPVFPLEGLKRKVFGLDPLGNRRTAVVASIDAPLWTGAASTFNLEANDNTVVVVQVIGRFAEQLPRPT